MNFAQLMSKESDKIEQVILKSKHIWVHTQH